MRGSQSDPTHTYAPVCPCPGVMLRACAHDMTHGRACPRLPQAPAYGKGWRWHAVARIQHFAGERFNGPVARFWCWPICWPTLARLRALAGRLMALAGLCCGLAMLGRARAGLRCLFSLYECTVLGGHTVCLAYVLSVCLSVWHSWAWHSWAWHGLAGGGACCNGYRSKPQGAAR